MLNPLLSGNGALRRVGTGASPEGRSDELGPRGEQQRRVTNDESSVLAQAGGLTPLATCSSVTQYIEAS